MKARGFQAPDDWAGFRALTSKWYTSYYPQFILNYEIYLLNFMYEFDFC